MRWLLALLLILTVSLADRDKHLPLDLHHLNLSASQYEAVKEIVKGYQHAFEAFDEEKEEIQKKIVHLFTQPSFDEVAFTEQNALVRDKLIALQRTFFAQMHKVLHEEQRKRFAKYMKEWDFDD